MNQFSNHYLMERYQELMQKSAKANGYTAGLINKVANQYVQELWARNGGWNG